MKQILLLLFFFIPYISKAQFNRGDIFLGGSFYMGGSYHSPYPQRVNHRFSFHSYSVAPTMGFLINESLAVGAKIGYARNKQLPYSNFNSFSAGAFLRRYFSVTDKFLFSLDGNLFFRRFISAYKSDQGNLWGDSYEIGTSIVPSFSFFLTSQWNIEASIGNVSFTHRRNLAGDHQSSNINITYNSISLGLLYYFKTHNR